MIGRTYEYKLIKEKMSSQKAELGIVYGRRKNILLNY
jgi:hypothetical protein